MSERGNIGGSLGNSRYFWTVTGKQSSDVLIKYTRVTGRSSSVHGMFLKYYVIVSREKNGMITMKRENTMIRPFGDKMPGTLKRLLTHNSKAYEQTMHIHRLEQPEGRCGQVHHDGAACQLFPLCEGKECRGYRLRLSPVQHPGATFP